MDEQLKQIIQLFSQPAFLVNEGVVSWCNSAAASLLCEGTPLSSLLEQQGSLFSFWDHSGTLQLPVVLGGADYDASVHSTPEGDLFVASRRGPEMMATAAAVFNASISLRRPLHSMVSAASAMFDQMEVSGTLTEAASRLNQSIYQLIRLSGQMSDGGRLLLHRRELNRLFGLTKQQGLTLVPLQLYFKNSMVKAEVGLCKGKKLYDKRADMAARDAKRDIDRAIKSRRAEA